MTGFGEARRQDDHLTATVEVRAINNRYFKFSARCSDGYSGLEPQIEAIVRRHVRRGTVQLNLRIERVTAADLYVLNEQVLDSYRRQLEEFHRRWHVSESVPLESLLALPGAVEDRSRVVDSQQAWPLVDGALQEAIGKLSEMRRAEGQAMKTDLAENLNAMADELAAIESRAPVVVEAFRDRLADRMNKLLSEYEVSVESADLVREVGLYAERSDISEEVVRLKSHIEQFRESLELAESSGRRLEFLTQEMLRETNTIGSKANDATIARHVIEIKTFIERIREMVQNVE